MLCQNILGSFFQQNLYVKIEWNVFDLQNFFRLFCDAKTYESRDFKFLVYNDNNIIHILILSDLLIVILFHSSVASYLPPETPPSSNWYVM